MNSAIAGPLISLVFTGIFLYLLFLVIRAGVEAGIRRSLDPRYLSREGGGGVSRIPD